MLTFYKYHGAGNDFVMIDNRDGVFDITDVEYIKLICHRRFGVGADGIIMVEKSDHYDFSMVFANNDGSIGSMCGNGGRCLVHFAHHILGIVSDSAHVIFDAVDGVHKASIDGDQVRLKMQNVGEIGNRNDLPFLYSGTTPHNISFVENLTEYPVVTEGEKLQKIEQDPRGMNINFVEYKSTANGGDGIFHVRTYERGVWDETLACGTGATSVAIACHSLGMYSENICHIQMPGGKLDIEFQKNDDGTYQNIWLTGPAKCVFKGEWK